MTDCTFSGNSATGSGGGMFNDSVSKPVVLNSIFCQYSDAGGMDESAQVHDAPGSASTVNYSDIQGGWTGAGGIGNIEADPLFVDPGFWENNGTPGSLGRRIVIQDKQLRSSEYLDTTRYSILASARIGGSTQYFATTVAT